MKSLPGESFLHPFIVSQMHPHQALPQLAVVRDEEVEQLASAGRCFR